MSNLNELKRLENDMKANPELAKKLDEAVKRIAAEGKAQNDGEVMAAAAKELGYDITLATLEQAQAEAEPVDLEALAEVTGGEEHYGYCEARTNYVCTANYGSKTEDEYGHDAQCVTAWHCATITLHTDSNDKQVVCWKDYLCYLVNKRQ